MNSEIKALPISRPPYADECLLGYLTRLGSLYGYPNGGWIAKLIGIDLERQSIFAISDRLVALATCTGAPIEELERIAIRLLPGKHSLVLPSGRSIKSKYMSKTTALVCEECIHEFGYVRMSWVFKYLPVCPIHHCLLVDHCSACGLPFHHLRSSIQC